MSHTVTQVAVTHLNGITWIRYTHSIREAASPLAAMLGLDRQLDARFFTADIFLKGMPYRNSLRDC